MQHVGDFGKQQELKIRKKERKKKQKKGQIKGEGREGGEKIVHSTPGGARF